MKSLKLRSRVGEDGVLRLQFPADLKNATLDVIVVFEQAGMTEPTDQRGWPAGFFDTTAGSIPDFPLDADEGFAFDASDDVAVATGHVDANQR